MEYNIEHGNGNFGGDMMLTPEQMEWIKGGDIDRALMTTHLWPKTGEYVYIPYTHIKTERWSERELQNIQAGMDAYTDNTCIRYFYQKFYQYRNLFLIAKLTILQN